MKSFSCHLLAFITGASGLVFQVIWARQFVQVFGATTQAAAIVLALFLCGLSLGARLLGRRADRTDHPLRLAACLLVVSSLLAAGEIAIILPIASGLDGIFYGTVTEFPRFRLFYQIVFASLVLLPPTFLLGGVAPALLRAMVSDDAHIRPGFSSLFAVETFGGACGALVAGFWWIATFGLQGAMWLAAAISLLIATVVAVTFRSPTPPQRSRLLKSSPNSATTVATAVDTTAATTAATTADRWLLAAVSLAGFSVLGMEVAWTRLLMLLLGGDTYAYTIVISSFLFGLAFGGLLALRFTSWLTQPLIAYAWLQMAVAGTSLALLILFSWLTGGVGQMWMASLERDWAMVLGGRFSLCFCILLVPSALAGVSFPVAASHFLRGPLDMGRRAGRVYAASALGNVMGALATGLLLIEMVGLQWSVVSLAAINLAAAACVVLASTRALRTAQAEDSMARQVAWRQAVLIVVGLSICVGWKWIWPVKPLGVNRDGIANKVVFYREELTGIVAVLQRRDSPSEQWMSIDGVVIGQSQGGVDEKQRLLAHLPFLLRPNPVSQRIYTIGLGTGILASELSHQSADVEVVCVELSPAVIEGARQFSDLNRDVHNDPQVELLVGDGIQYLRRTSTTFDAIVSDAKSRPGHVGNAAFYSFDFYSLCRKRLSPGGLMTQWISLETPARELQTILNTFGKSFPQSYFGIAAPDSIYLIGSAHPLEVDLSHMQTHLDSPTSTKLREYHWRDACDILGLLAADGATVRQWLDGDEILNTLQRPVLEYQSLDAFQTSATVRKQSNVATLLRLTERRPDSLRIAVEDETKWRECSRSARLLLEATVLVGEARLAEALTRLDEGLPNASRHTQFRKLAGEVYFQQAKAAAEVNDATSAIHYYRQVAKTLDDDDVAGHWQLASAFQHVGGLSQSADEYYKALQADPENPDLRLEFAALLVAMQKYPQSIRQFQRVVQSHPNHARAHLGLGLALQIQMDERQARYHLDQSVKLDPSLRNTVKQNGVRLDAD